jgi:hypothetical protein
VSERSSRSERANKDLGNDEGDRGEGSLPSMRRMQHDGGSPTHQIENASFNLTWTGVSTIRSSGVFPSAGRRTSCGRETDARGHPDRASPIG